MVIRYEGVPFVARFRWSVGEVFDEFLKALKDMKLLASKCKCGYIVFPPRIRCPKCSIKLEKDNLVTLDGKGIIESYTRVYFKLDGNGNEIWLEKPETLAMIRFNNANSVVVLPSFDPEIKEGDEVEIVWKEERTGSLSDILGVRKVRK